MFLTIGAIIIDDIVLPDGQTHMNTLGGGTTHAAMGMRAWSDQVRPISGVGLDFSSELMHQLSQVFDLKGLLSRAGVPTARAWQLFETDGHRTEVFRTPIEDFKILNAKPTEISLDLLKAAGVHLQAQTPDPAFDWIDRLRVAGNPFILWEPWDTFCTPENREVFARLAKKVDAVSPNLEEGRTLTGADAPLEVLDRLLATGSPVVALRMGAEGSLVARQGEPVLTIPAVKTGRIVDVTGAGNAFCGGFIVGIAQTGDLAQAAQRAAVSASLALEQFGALIPLEGLAERAASRLPLARITPRASR